MHAASCDPVMLVNYKNSLTTNLIGFDTIEINLVVHVDDVVVVNVVVVALLVIGYVIFSCGNKLKGLYWFKCC